MSTDGLNVFTVDTEEWFHICGVPALDTPRWPTLPSRVELTTRLLLEDLAGAGVRATFLVLGWIAERHPALVREILDAGHEVGSHGHLHRRTHVMTRQAFASDLRASLRALTDAGAPPVRSFRAPEWSLDDEVAWALEELTAAGIRVDGSRAPVRLVGRVDWPRLPHALRTSGGELIELPPLVADRFGQTMPLGWGWGLRMSTPARVRRAIDAANRAGRPAVLMVHPWEIDPAPPHVVLPPRLRFAHYFRLGGFRRRLKEIMSHTRFITMSEAAWIVRASRS